jgi:4-amino-4-deoxy-L-arabinose transferase-like glycosyltransferase
VAGAHIFDSSNTIIPMKSWTLLAIIGLLAFVLRVYQLGSIPPGLYSDEVSIAVNAKSILLTGKDEWGKPFPVLFRAYGEYKLPVYIYLTAVLEKLLGYTDLAVRVPSAAAGTLAVIAAYMLIVGWGKKPALLTALFMTISPWHLQFSRGGFESSVAFSLTLWAAVFFLKGLVRHRYLAVAFVCAVTATQTYLSARVFVPLMAVMIVVIFWPKLRLSKKELFSLAVFMFVIIAALFSTYISFESSIRFQSQSVLTMGGNLLNNLTENLIKNFSFDFLFFHGDPNPRHGLLVMGELYYWQLPLIVIGGGYVFKKSKELFALLIAWLAIGSLPVALSSVSPHALRGLLMVFPWQAFSTFGAICLLKMKTTKWIVAPMVALFLIFYLHSYYVHIPSELGKAWGDGIKQAVIFADSSPVPRVYVQEKILWPYFHWYANNEKFIYVEGSRSLTDLKDPGAWLIAPVEIALPYKTIRDVSYVSGDVGWKIYEL